MRNLLTISLLLALISCNERNVEGEVTKYKVSKNRVTPLDIVVIDSCEYFFSEDSNDSFLTHKGNCKFCRRRNNHE